MKLELNWLD